MSNPTPDTGGRPDPKAEHASPRSASGPAPRKGAVDQSGGRYDDAEAQLGGADAIEKTTYVVGEGVEPDARPRGRYAARDAASGVPVAAWIVGGLAVLIALVYAIGIFR